MKSKSYRSDEEYDEYLDESQLDLPNTHKDDPIFKNYTPFITHQTKSSRNKVKAGYTKAMRDVLLHNNNINDKKSEKLKINSNYVKSMRSILHNNKKIEPKKHEKESTLDKNIESDDDFVNESQIDIESENHINNNTQKSDNSFILSQGTKELVDNYEKDVNKDGSKKEIINGHVLRKRNANQYHIYQVDKLNYDKITERMKSARYELDEDINTQQNDEGFDQYYENEYDENEEEYGSYSDKNLSEDGDSINDSFFNDAENHLKLVNNNIESKNSKKAEIILLEESDYSESSFSEEEDEVEEIQKKRKTKELNRITRSKYRTRNLKTSSPFSNWGPLKKNITKKEKKPKVINLFESDTDSGSEFINDFKLAKNTSSHTFSGKELTNSNSSSKTLENDMNTTPKTFSTKNSKEKTLSETIPDSLKNKRKKRINKNKQIDDFFQAHLEVPISENFSNDYSNNDSVDEEFFSPKKATYQPLISRNQHASISIMSSNIFNFLTSDGKRSYTPMIVTYKVDIPKFLDTLFNNDSLQILDYEKLLDYLLVGDYIVDQTLTLFEEFILAYRKHLVDPQKQTNDHFVNCFFKSGCIPSLSFLAMLLNKKNKNFKSIILSKMTNSLVRFINNIFKVNANANTCLNIETKYVFKFIIQQYPHEFQKIMDYYKSKPEKYKKKFYNMVFIDLKVKVKSNNIKSFCSNINDLYYKQVVTSQILLEENSVNVDKEELKTLLMSFKNLYKPYKEEMVFDENFIFTLRSLFKKDGAFTKTNVFFLYVKVLYKFKDIFQSDDEFNMDLFDHLRPSINSVDEDSRVSLRKINMCVILCYLNYNNLSMILPILIKLLNLFSFDKNALTKLYKLTDIEAIIYKDCFEQCFKLFAAKHKEKEIDLNYFFNSLKDMWIDFYSNKWNLLGEQLTNKSTVEIFTIFIKKIYNYEPQMALNSIKEILMQTINIDDHLSPIYKFCINVVINDKNVDANWIKIQIYDKLFMFFKSCDSIETYMKVIERLLGISNIEIFGFNKYKSFFKIKDDLLIFDYYMQMSYIKTNDKRLLFKLKNYIFKFIKKCIIKWILNPNVFGSISTTPGLQTNDYKLVDIIKNYLVITKNLLIMTHTLFATIISFLKECNFDDFKNLIIEIDALPSCDHLIVKKLFFNCNLSYDKRHDQTYLQLLLKYNIADKTTVLDTVIHEFRHSNNLTKFVDKISENEIGFDNFIEYLLHNDISNFAKVYSFIKNPHHRYKVDMKLVEYLKRRCLLVSFDEWNIITELPTTDSSLNKLKSAMVDGTKKQERNN